MNDDPGEAHWTPAKEQEADRLLKELREGRNDSPRKKEDGEDEG